MERLFVLKDAEESEELLYSGQTLKNPFLEVDQSMTPFGTPIPFEVMGDSDCIMKNGVYQEVTTKWQTITRMSSYCEKSIDELRFEDYCCWKAVEYRNRVFVSHVDNLIVDLNQPSAPKCIPAFWPLPSITLVTQADSRRNSGAKPASDFLISSDGNFCSEGDRDFVLNPKQPCPEDSCVGKEPLSTVTGKLQLRDTLVQNIVKCRKIQNSLYRLVLLKLQSHVTAVTRDHTDSNCKETSASTIEQSGANENITAGDPSLEDVTGSVHGASEVLTTESEVEGLNDSLVCPSEKNEEENAGYAASDVVGAELNIVPEVPTMESEINTSGESDVSKAANENSSSVQESEGDSVRFISKSSLCTSTQASSSVSSSGDVSSHKSQVSRLCRRAFLCDLKEPLDTLVRCTDIQRSLFHNLTIVSTTSSEEAVVISQRKKHSCLNNSKETDEFTDNSFWRHIPHGRGTLKTASGEPIYSGDWCKGKRHGKGKGVIFSLSTSGNVAAEHGVYSGEWKDNMRHGRGNMMFFSGAVYDGQWKFDEMTGYGTLTLPDGSIQEGIWRDGKLHGCAVFTWPHGVSEYREYDATRGQLSSCTRERQTTNSMPQMVSIYPQLLSFQGTLSELIRERHFLRKDVAALKKENAEMITKAQIHTFEFRKRYQEQMVTSYEKERNEAEKALKAATEEAAQLKKELEETKAALVCQICFSRPRDCILLPCSHLLYCRDCVSEQRKNGDSRCPTCRGTINSEILCNINHPL
ncbi:uncharacterized protein LOC141883918 isoform X2 [Acropora palmata]|uniref:uncharacterized protein LOC141883918 isoform X2 n=1 Tax=Acropora palmata TaxID=6131 RepID=UPI003D9FDA54